MPSSWRVRAHPEDLATSAVSVHGHAADVQLGHGAANARLMAAQAGLVGVSAAVFNAKVAVWQARSEAIVARLTDHADALAMTATEFTRTDVDGGQRIAATQQLNPGPVPD